MKINTMFIFMILMSVVSIKSYCFNCNDEYETYRSRILAIQNFDTIKKQLRLITNTDLDCVKGIVSVVYNGNYYQYMKDNWQRIMESDYYILERFCSKCFEDGFEKDMYKKIKDQIMYIDKYFNNKEKKPLINFYKSKEHFIKEKIKELYDTLRAVDTDNFDSDNDSKSERAIDKQDCNKNENISELNEVVEELTVLR